MVPLDSAADVTLAAKRPGGEGVNTALTNIVVVNNLPNLANRINAATAAAEDSARSVVEHALVAGRLLIDAKASVPHGGWEDWLTTNCTVAPRTAQAYMRLAKNINELPAPEAQRVADLPLREALRAITTKPETPPSSCGSTRLVPVRRDDVERTVHALRKSATVIRKFASSIDRYHMLRPSQIAVLKKMMIDAMAVLDQIGGTEMITVEDLRDDDGVRARERFEELRTKFTEVGLELRRSAGGFILVSNVSSRHAVDLESLAQILKRRRT